MRYEDTSGSVSSSATPEARDDADLLPTGSNGPATGNVITGAGTTTGTAGADAALGAHVVAVRGAGGTDTADTGATLQVDGRYGALVMDENGAYKYVANGEAPDNFRDLFQYTLADSKGGRSVADLVISRGGEIQVSENAQRITPGPDGVVTLPPGVTLSDVQVVGRDLVVTLPDGSQIVIVDGAVFVPQLVLGGVEVPASNLAALLVDSEIRTTAGTPQSGGGNFSVAVPDLDPGVPLGDLIPPTELVFNLPDFEEIGQILDRDPEAGAVAVQLDDDAKAGGNPGGTGDDPDSVNATGFLPGSEGDGDLTWDLLSGGAPAGFTYVDGPGGSILVQQVQGAVTVTVLTITVDAATGAYTVTQNAPILHATGDNENNSIFTLGYTVTDEDGDSALGSITINVDDDTPTVTVTAGSDANVILTTHDAATIGAASEAVSTAVNFSGVFTGTTVSPGADGAGAGTTSGYALSTTGGASGLTQGGVAINLYNVGGVIVGSTATTSADITTANTVFTVSTTNTGIVTLTQFSQIDHTNTDPSPTGSPFTDHIISLADGSITLTRTETVVDKDGDSVTGSASVAIGANLRFVDDGPSISLADRGEPDLVVDETILADNATASFAANFSANFGADGPAVAGGGMTYALGINAGATGLTDTLTGAAVVLSVNGSGQVVGTAGAGGPTVFIVSVDASGNVTLDQQRAVVHNDPADHDEPGASAATLNADNLITLTGTATDRDGDTASQTLNIGLNLHFEDDGPSVSNVQAGPGVLLDETTGAIAGTAGGMTTISATSASAVITATAAFGNDGPAASGATVYGLSLTGGGSTLASGLQTAVGDFPITLNLVDSTHITGTYNGSNIAFTITMNADGTITVAQNVPLEHLIDGSSAAEHDDALDLVLDGQLTNLINATITIKDGDSDTATGSVGIGHLIVFEDDGPAIDVTAGADAAVTVQTQDGDTIGGASDTATTSANFGGVFGVTSSGGADGAAAVATLNYSLGVSVQGVDSGLNQGGANIYLYKDASGNIVGSTSDTFIGVNGGNTVFNVTVSATGVVTLTQFSQIDHPIAGDPSATGTPFVDHILSIADELVTLTASSTVTDNDGDTATDSASVNIGANLQFADDGPDVGATLVSEARIRIDETDGVGNAPGEVDVVGGNLGTVTVVRADYLTLSNPHVSADSPTTYGYALQLGPVGGNGLVNSGLLLSTTNDPIYLYNVGGTIVGSTALTAPATVGDASVVFTVSINASGDVTLTQIKAVEHSNTSSVDEDSSPLAAGALNVVVTATDFDGDTDTASVDLGSIIRFEDDGPSITVTSTNEAAVLVQTQDADTIGTATDTASSSANFGGVFGITSSGGSDGTASVSSLSYALGVPGAGVNGVDSGLDQGANNIYLHSIGGKVVGSTSQTLAGVTVGNTVFDVAVSGTGVVTLTQYSQINHPAVDDPSPTITPFADHIISMADGLITLTATASITDNDGDTVADSETIGIGANLQFADHGPVAVGETDTIVGGNGPATGNVITGIDIALGDTNTTDGNADTVGADTPGTITRIQSVNNGNIDTSYDGSGNLVVIGQYGTLTINADGSYSYLRTSAAGGVSDTFTYTLTDRDGDTATANLTIAIQDNFPSAGTVNVLLDDDALAGGNPGTPAVFDDVDSQNASGTLPGSGGDAPLTFSLSTAGAPAGFTYVDGPGESILIQQGGTTVLTVTITNTTTGAYTVVQNAPILHDPQTGVVGSDNTENNQTFAITYNVTDFDSDVANPAGTININVDDDTPTVTAAGAQPTLAVDETTLTTDDTDDFSGIFTSSFGADGAALANATVYTLGINAGATGIVDTLSGQAVVLSINGSGQVEGRTSGSNLLVFVVSVDADGNVTLDQRRAVVHNDPADHDEPGPSAVTLAADNLITLTKTVTDKDGDSASATANIGQNLQFEDDGPAAAVVTTGELVSVDESAGLQTDANDVAGPLAVFNGVTTKGVDPDMAPQFATSDAALVASTGTTFGADGGTAAFSLNVSSAGVDSGLDTTEGTSILLYKEGDLIVGRVGSQAGAAAFALSIDPATGIVSMVEYLSIKHPDATNPDDSVSIANGAVLATVTATDGDGDTSTASTAIGSLISFQDAGPVMTAASNINIQNGSVDMAHSGTFAFNLGADGAATNNDVITNITFSATVNGSPVINPLIGETVAETASSVTYTFSFSYVTGPGAPPPTAAASGTITFDKVGGTYTVDLVSPIQGFTTIVQTATGTLFQGYEFGTSNVDGSQPEISVTQIQGTPGTPLASDLFLQFTSVAEPSSGTGDNALEVTAWVPGADNPAPIDGGGDTSWSAGQLFNQDNSWVSTSNSDNGVAGDTIQGGEVLDFMIAKGPNPTGTLVQPANFGTASTMFLKFDGIGSSEDFIIILKLYDTVAGTYTTKALIVENADIQKGPGSGPGIFSTISLDQNDGLIIIEPNDYQQGNTNLVIVGAQIAGSDEGVTGTGLNFNYGGTLGVASTVAQDFDADVSDGPMKISSIGLLSQTTSAQPAQLTFNVTVTDGDGDSIVQTIVTTISAAADSSTPIVLSPAVTTIQMVSQEPLTAGNDNQKSNSNAVMMGAFAAAGMDAANTLSGYDGGGVGGTQYMAMDITAGYQGALPSLSSANSFSSSLGGDLLAHNISIQGADYGGSGFRGTSFTQASDLSGLQAAPMVQQQVSAEFLAGTQMPAHAQVVSVAPAPVVAMPGAEQLAGLIGAANGGITGGQHSQIVSQVIADALQGGGNGVSIDGLLGTLAGHGGGSGNAALEALASHGGAGVPNGDSSIFGGFTAHNSAFTMETMLVHVDAVQPHA